MVPLLGRALHLRLRPAARVTWAGAGWAALCGIVAAGMPQPNLDTLLQILLTLFLADSVLSAAWMALLRVRDPNFRESFTPNDRPATPAPERPVSLEARVMNPTPRPETQLPFDEETLESLNLEPTETAFWVSWGAGISGHPTLPLVDSPATGTMTKSGRPSGSIHARWQFCLEVGLAYALALLLGLILGQGIATIVALGLLFPLVVWFALGGRALLDGWTRAVLEIGLPWTIGVAAFSTFPTDNIGGLSGPVLSAIFWSGNYPVPLALGLLFAMVYYGELTSEQPHEVIDRRIFINLPQIAVVVLLVVWRQPILAGVAAILVIAQMLFQPYLRQHGTRWYLQSTQWMFMGVMLIAAIGVAVHQL